MKLKYLFFVALILLGFSFINVDRDCKSTINSVRTKYNEMYSTQLSYSVTVRSVTTEDQIKGEELVSWISRYNEMLNVDNKYMSMYVDEDHVLFIIKGTKEMILKNRVKSESSATFNFDSLLTKATTYNCDKNGELEFVFSNKYGLSSQILEYDPSTFELISTRLLVRNKNAFVLNETFYESYIVSKPKNEMKYSIIELLNGEFVKLDMFNSYLLKDLRNTY